MIKQITKQPGKKHLLPGLVMIALAMLLLLTACRKGVDASSENRLPLESYSQVQIVNFNNQDTSLKLLYNNQQEAPPVPNDDGRYFLPIGNTQIVLADRTDNSILFQGNFNIKPGADTLTFFQPDSTFSPQLLVNNQTSEPPPPPGYIKIKLANLAPELLGTEPVNMIMQAFKFDENYNYVPIPGAVDTLEGITNSFPDDYQLLKANFTYRDQYAVYPAPIVLYKIYTLKDKTPVPLPDAIPYSIFIDLSGNKAIFTTYFAPMDWDRSQAQFTHVFTDGVFDGGNPDIRPQKPPY